MCQLLGNLINFRKLCSVLSGCNLVDVGLETSAQRMVKSQQEIDVIKLGAATADVGGAACYQALARGGEGTMEWQAFY